MTGRYLQAWNDIFVRIQLIILQTMISFFIDNFSASIFMKISVSRLHPPYADITNGVKEPCSISITRWLYFRFFSFSLLINELVRDWLR